MSNKVPRNYKGTRDWLAEDASLRTEVIETLRGVFELFGFEPLETPIIEMYDTLMGKGGEETNKLVYTFTKGEDDIGLRFDHTVPFARVVAQHAAELTFPYRRYAIGPVFRADKPQKDRYRQFWQCDFDIVGASSPVADAEVIALSYVALTRLGFAGQFTIHVFDRHALNGMAQAIGAAKREQALAILRGWDKLAKATRAQIDAEIAKAGVNKEAFNRYTDELLAITRAQLGSKEVLGEIARLFPTNELLSKGLSSLGAIMGYLDKYEVPPERVRINPTLARGLDYYTGPIFETVAEGLGGSVTGGGRFDNLIEELGGPSIPATGSSFGLERVTKVMEILGLVKTKKTPVQVFVATFDSKNNGTLENAVTMASELRAAGIPTELFVGDGALGKQLHVADRRGAQYAVFAGPDEMTNNVVIVKDLRAEIQNSGKGKMKAANQRQVPRAELVAELSRLLA